MKFMTRQETRDRKKELNHLECVVAKLGIVKAVQDKTTTPNQDRMSDRPLLIPTCHSF